MMKDEPRLLLCVDGQLLPQREVFQLLPQSEGVKHGEYIIEHVPGRDVDECH